MTDLDVIEAIGAKKIMEALDVSADAVKKWRQRGIPWRYRARIQQIAIAAGIGKELPRRFLDEQVAA